MISPVLKSRGLHLAHHPQSAGHNNVIKLYRTLRGDFHWPKPATNCHATTTTTMKNRIRLWERRDPMKLFQAKVPPMHISSDIMGELICSGRGNQYVLLVTDRFSNLTRAVSLKRIIGLDNAACFPRRICLRPQATVISAIR